MIKKANNDERKTIIKIEFMDLAKLICQNLDNCLDSNFDKEIRLKTHIIDIKVNIKESLIIEPKKR